MGARLEDEFLSLVVNGQTYNLRVGDEKGVLPHHTLAYTLREILGLKGTKVSCDSGQCGSCTVIMNGKAVLSCMTLTIECHGKEIRTIEGLRRGEELDPLQEAFARHSAFQCGFCTPGMIMAAKALLLEEERPTEEQIKEALSGHFCRCISHYQVIDAIKEASGQELSEDRLVREEKRVAFRYVGKPVQRVDALRIVSGTMEYLDDIRLEGMLFGKVLRSPYPHALIKRIELARAKALRGVRAILTYQDVPDLRGGKPRFRRILDKKVRFVGDAVALVAADTEETAEEATRLIEVEYEELPPVFDPDEAMRETAPLLYEDFPRNLLPSQTGVYGPRTLTELVTGSIEDGLKEADAVVEDEFSYSGLPNPVPIEAPSAIAFWEDSKRLTVFVSNQASYLDKVVLSVILGKEIEVRTLGLPCGGSFGTKLMSWPVQLYAALLSRATGRPVKVRLKKDEHLATFTLRPSVRLRGKVGMKIDGRLTAVQGDLVVDTGHYSMTTHAQLAVGLGEVQIMARCKNWHLKPVIVVTNRNASGIVRGFGGQEIKCVLIPLLCRAMERLNIDPFEFFRMHFVKPGDGYFWRDGNWYNFRGIDFTKAMDKGAEVFGWKEKWKGWLTPTDQQGPKRRGVGVAVHGNADVGEDISEAFLTLHPEGRATLFSCVTEHGTGQITNYLKMVAEVLGLPLDRVRLAPADSSITPFEFGPVGSRGTYAIGGAAIRAAEDARRKLLELSAPLFDCEPERLETKDGLVFLRDEPSRTIPWSRIMGWERTIHGYGRFEPDYTLTNCMMSFVEVEVDVETGKVDLLRVVNATDVGQIIDPKGLEGQLNGCLGSAGIDSAIFEETILDRRRGYIMNANLIDYKWRTFLELPSIRHVVLETPFPTHRFGSIGVGEIATSPGPAAVFMAVCNAIGRWVREYPLTPERIIKALQS